MGTRGGGLGVFSTREKANRLLRIAPSDEDGGGVLYWLVEEYIIDALCGEGDDDAYTGTVEL